MKLKIYVRIETVDLLLAKKNETIDWLADQLSTSSWYAREMVKGNIPVSPDMRKKIILAFRGMSIKQGKAKWDDFFRIKEEA